MDDEHFMKMALDLAVKGEGFTSPNPMVGAVVVKDGRVVGSGYHQMVGGPHAEVNAIDAAGQLADGATLYTDDGGEPSAFQITAVTWTTSSCRRVWLSLAASALSSVRKTTWVRPSR